jgi:hypothetical protein
MRKNKYAPSMGHPLFVVGEARGRKDRLPK